MAWQVGYRGLVQACPSVNVHGVDQIICWFCDRFRGVCRSILPRRSEKQATVRSKSKPSEERSVGLVSVNAMILDRHCRRLSGQEWVR